MNFRLTYSPIDVVFDDIAHSARKMWKVRFFSWIKNFLLEGLLKDFTRLNTELRGLLILIRENNFPINNPGREYNKSMEGVRSLTKIKNIYISLNYFGNSELENLVNNALNISYEIESELKIMALPAKSIVKEDADLKNALSLVSQKAINKKLAADIE